MRSWAQVRHYPRPAIALEPLAVEDQIIRRLILPAHREVLFAHTHMITGTWTIESSNAIIFPDVARRAAKLKIPQTIVPCFAISVMNLKRSLCSFTSLTFLSITRHKLIIRDPVITPP